MGTFVTANTPLPAPKVDGTPPQGLASEVDAADINGLWSAIGDVRDYVRSQPLADPAPPTFPIYVENANTFLGGGSEVPANVTAYPVTGQAGAFQLTLVVTGAVNATTLTVVSGPLADAGVTTSGWAAVIKHDDTTWGVYTVTTTNVGGSSLTIRPALRAAVTAGTLSNLHNAALGQHYTPNGYIALAESIWAYQPWRGIRGRIIAQTRETDVGVAWSLVGTLTINRVTENRSRNYFDGASSPFATVATARTGASTEWNATAANQGLTWTVQLGGKTGYVDTYVGTQFGNNAQRVQIIIDGVTVLDKTTFGLERVAARFRNANVGTITITNPVFTANTDNYRVGTTTWWELPQNVPTSMFAPGAKVVYVGDSWGAFYSGIGPATLATHISAQGGTLINVAVAGQTAQWARDNFSTLVLANTPDVAIFEFFVNDFNTYGTGAIATWQGNINWLIDQSLLNGIQPIIIMPAATASSAQSSGLATYGASEAEGVGPPPLAWTRTVVNYAATMNINARVAEEFVIPASNATAFTIANPTNGIVGQRIDIRVQNLTAGALGVITWGAAYKLAGAFTSPATATNRVVSFRSDGTNWNEINRSAADVPN